ncbi:MAG: carbohydrate ABC transporter permease [Candidatus Bipolaricaulaceae bacterium]
MNKLGRSLKQGILHILALSVTVLALLPISWLISTSLKSPLEFLGGGVTLLPRHPTLAHYHEVLFERGFFRFLFNTAVIALAATALSIWAGSLAAYALTRFRFPGKLDALFLLWALVIRTIPPMVLAVPLFILFRDLGLSSVKVILILAYQIYTLPLTVWMLLGFFREIPKEIEEAALIDGASRVQVLLRIVYPLITPGLAASAIFCIITTWNEFTYALIFARAPADFTVPIGLATFITEYRTLWGPLAAGSLISSLPLLVFTLFVQRHLLRGFALRGVF